MQLQYVSITGADDEVNVDDLSIIADQYPFVEWAILLMPEVAGTLRFPSLSWIENFKRDYTGKYTAMHLCGGAFLRFVEGDPEILSAMKGINRIQLNLKFGGVEGKYDTDALVARVKSSPEWQFILQYGHEKAGLLPLFEGVPNHAVLFDESAGRGVSPESWDAPLEGHFCGYAGGINPDNVQQNIDMIEKVADGYTTWIDMESGVRTDDHFDLEKVRTVLSIAAPYTNMI